MACRVQERRKRRSRASKATEAGLDGDVVEVTTYYTYPVALVAIAAGFYGTLQAGIKVGSARSFYIIPQLLMVESTALFKLWAQLPEMPLIL